jgi:adenosylhomocysteine nucleosidase
METSPGEESKTCHLGIVFALGIESGCFEDLLQGVVTIRGSGFIAREGGHHGRRVVVILSGPGRKNAAQATDVLIDGHRPRWVISAGFAGALAPYLKRNDILIADRLLDISGGADISVGPRQDATPCSPAQGATACLQAVPSAGCPPNTACEQAAAHGGPGVHRGPLLTADRVVRLPGEKKSLFDRFGALAVDMETFAVAEVCLRRQVPFSSIRAINDTADQRLPRDMESLLAQKTGAARLGAALSAVWRRPAAAKDLYQLREDALIASGRLAQFLAETFVAENTILSRNTNLR